MMQSHLLRVVITIALYEALRCTRITLQDDHITTEEVLILFAWTLSFHLTVLHFLQTTSPTITPPSTTVPDDLKEIVGEALIGINNPALHNLSRRHG